MTVRTRVLLTSVDGEGNALPSEFRLFRRGLNKTRKGDFIFDDAAARSVMSAYADHGVDVHIDLEHLSQNQKSPNYDGDARGWAKLELRDGELWAVGVTWTPDGQARLSEKRQRYISPTFYHDESGRITELVNMALTGLPATDEPQALTAASRVQLSGAGKRMDPELIKKAIEAIEKADANAALELVKQLVTSAATGGEADAESVAAEETDGADASAEVAASEAVEDEKTPSEDEKRAALAVLGLTPEAFAQLNLSASNERLELVRKLVTLGGETPASAWDGEPKDRKLRARLSREPIEDLRERVTALSKAKPAAIKPATERASAKPAVKIATLSAVELAQCKQRGIEPEEFLARKAKIKVNG